jgi:hypothetical protein
MPDMPPRDPYAHLRAHAAAQRQATIDRPAAGIATLEGAGRPVTVFTIREVTGLDYSAYYRNPEALALFRWHSTHLRAAREQRVTGTRRRKQPSDQGPPEALPPRDPLAGYTKPRLLRMIHGLRQALAEREALGQQYRALLQEHMQCALTIARLQEETREAAEYRELLRGLRTKGEREEHGGTA